MWLFLTCCCSIQKLEWASFHVKDCKAFKSWHAVKQIAKDNRHLLLFQASAPFAQSQPGIALAQATYQTYHNFSCACSILPAIMRFLSFVLCHCARNKSKCSCLPYTRTLSEMPDFLRCSNGVLTHGLHRDLWLKWTKRNRSSQHFCSWSGSTVLIVAATPAACSSNACGMLV